MRSRPASGQKRRELLTSTKLGCCKVVEAPYLHLYAQNLRCSRPLLRVASEVAHCLLNFSSLLDTTLCNTSIAGVLCENTISSNSSADTRQSAASFSSLTMRSGGPRFELTQLMNRDMTKHAPSIIMVGREVTVTLSALTRTQTIKFLSDFHSAAGASSNFSCCGVSRLTAHRVLFSSMCGLLAAVSSINAASIAAELFCG